MTVHDNYMNYMNYIAVELFYRNKSYILDILIMSS